MTLAASDSYTRAGRVKRVNLPNALTLSRIFVVPLLVVVLLTPFSEHWFGVPRHILGVARAGTFRFYVNVEALP